MITEGPTQLRVSWVHAPGAQDGYQVTLYQAGAQAGTSPVGAQVDSTSFSALTPGTQYEVEVISKAGPLHSAAANASGWTCEWGLERWAGLPLRPPGSLLSSTFAPAFAPFPKLHTRGPRLGSTHLWPRALGPRQPGSPAPLPSTAPLTPNELLVSMQAGSAVISLAWAGGPLGHGVCHAQLSETGHLSWEQPLRLGQARLVLRDLTPGRNLSLSVLCRAGPLRASTHPVVLPVGMLVSAGGQGRGPEWQGPVQVVALPVPLLPCGCLPTPAPGICLLGFSRRAVMSKGEVVSHVAGAPFCGHKCPIPLHLLV